jgi:hypothetical protein
VTRRYAELCQQYRIGLVVGDRYGTWLFPEVAPGINGAAAWSKWFGRTSKHGITDAAKVFHNFTDALRAAGVSEEMNRVRVGHSDSSVHASGVGTARRKWPGGSVRNSVKP